MKLLRLIALLGMLTLLAACSSSARSSQGGQINPVLRLRALPAADSQKFLSVRNMRDWKNPYLIVRVDGIGLLDMVNNEQRILKPDEVVDVLAQLPSSAWPYGRVVAVAEDAASSDDERARVRKNRALLAGTLENLQVLIDWVPAS